MQIRRYTPADCPAMAALFYDTVHRVNCRDYAPEQLDVWATGQVDLESWNRSFLAHHTLVAMKDGVLVGFGDMDSTGYLDRLYVHRDWQGRGGGLRPVRRPARRPAHPRLPHRKALL